MQSENLIRLLDDYRWKCRRGKARFVPSKRIALDGKTWWCVLDKKEIKYVPGMKARLRRETESAIVLGMLHGRLPSD